MDPWQIIGAAVVIVCGLVGVIYWAGQSRDDKQDTRAERNEKDFDEHVKDDFRAHERLTAVETKVANIEAEVRSLREKWHDLRGEITHTLADWYADLVERMKK